MDVGRDYRRTGPDRRAAALPQTLQAAPAGQWRQNGRQHAALKASGRPETGPGAQQEAPIESAHVHPQPFAPIGMAPDEDPTQPSGFAPVGKGSFPPFAPLALQSPAAHATKAPPVAVDGPLGVHPPLPASSSLPLRFGHVTAQSLWLQVQRDFRTGVSLVGHPDPGPGRNHRDFFGSCPNRVPSTFIPIPSSRAGRTEFSRASSPCSTTCNP